MENKLERYVVTSQQDIYQINKDNKPNKLIHLPDEFKTPFTSGLLDDKKIVLGNSSQGILILDLKSKELLHLSKKEWLVG